MKNQIFLAMIFIFTISFTSALLPTGYLLRNTSTGQFDKIVTNNYYVNETSYVCNQVQSGEPVCSYPQIEIYDEASCGCSQYGPIGNCYEHFPKEERPECYFNVDDTTQQPTCTTPTQQVCGNVITQREILLTQPAPTLIVFGNRTAMRADIVSVDEIRTNSIPAKNESWLFFKNIYGDANKNFQKTTHFAYISDFLGSTLNFEQRVSYLEGFAYWMVKHIDTITTDVSALKAENTQLKANLTLQTNRINAVKNCGNYANVTSVTTLKNCLRVI